MASESLEWNLDVTKDDLMLVYGLLIYPWGSRVSSKLAATHYKPRQHARQASGLLWWRSLGSKVARRWHLVVRP